MEKGIITISYYRYKAMQLGYASNKVGHFSLLVLLNYQFSSSFRDTIDQRLNVRAR
jgi:hypothetical protein